MELGAALSSRLLGFAVDFLCPSDILCLSHGADIDSLHFPPAMSNPLGWDSHQAGRLLPACRNLGGMDRQTLPGHSEQLQDVLAAAAFSPAPGAGVCRGEQLRAGGRMGWSQIPRTRSARASRAGGAAQAQVAVPFPGTTGTKSPLLDKFASESVCLLHSHLSVG